MHGQKMRFSAALALILTMSIAQGCISKGSKDRMAPPSVHTLSAAQEHEMTAVLVSVAESSPPSDQPLHLLPEHGIRWGDIRRAMDKAAESNHLAVLNERKIDDDHVKFTLISLEGWPAQLTVTRLAKAPWVSAESRVGPYPDDRSMQQRAITLNASFLEWMSTFGRMRRVPTLY